MLTPLAAGPTWGERGRALPSTQDCGHCHAPGAMPLLSCAKHLRLSMLELIKSLLQGWELY